MRVLPPQQTVPMASVEVTPQAPQTVPGLHQLQNQDLVDQWRIEKKLGVGGCGDVYKVCHKKNSEKIYALKTERANISVRMLKMEVVVLRTLNDADCSHCCEILDTGRFLDYNYIVMTLVGPSLQDLRKLRPPGTQFFSKGCALSVGMQCLEAIQQLHNIGYLHRDLKPANFCIAIDDKRKIIMLDFGMCRKYASINSHLAREMSRKDDLESWLYQQIEITNSQLSWKGYIDPVKVCYSKETARTTGLTELFGGCPKEYIHAMFYIDSLRYYDDVNYACLRGLLREALLNNDLNEFPYDWEKRG